MADGIYQSVMSFFIPYLAVAGVAFVSSDGLDVSDRLRFGAYIAHPAVITINLYILINTYRWDWLSLLVIAISDLFIFFWTGVFTSTTYSGYFYQTAPQVYGQVSFWVVFLITPVVCILPRFAVKAIQKVYWPYDVDIIREQVRLGKFDRLKPSQNSDIGVLNGSTTGSSDSSARRANNGHNHVASVDEEQRPIYPPSTVTTHHTQNGSNATSYTMSAVGGGVGGESSAAAAAQQGHRARPSVDRARPSFDRIRASMDRVRPSYEASSDFTSAARLTRLESSHSNHGNRFRRLRGLSTISGHKGS